jgi:K+-sensing histidine kinase KdpD
VEQLHSSAVRRGGFETIQPGERTIVPVRRRVVAYVLAVVLPVVTAIALIPIRVDHARVTLLVLVLPVVLVALLGTTGPAIVAAACSVLAFDFFLAAPYYSFAIEDSDEIVAAATLFVVAVVVGVLNAQLVRARIRDSARRDELRHLTAFARTVANVRGEGPLTEAACEHIASVLRLEQCAWVPGGEDLTRPVLLADGNLMGRLVDLNDDRATLPEQIQLPVRVDEVAIGSFVLTSNGREIVSFEERRTAATIAGLFGRAVTSLVPTGT